MSDQPVPTYWDYLKLNSLLGLQSGLEGDEDQICPDELHFIVVHQVYELWFKMVLREVREARKELASPKVPEEKLPHVVHHLRRVNQIFDLGLQQWKVMESLTPQDFLDFRDKLIPASGFQSFQMRELEVVVGLEEAKRHSYGGTNTFDHIKNLAARSPAGAFAWGRIQKALDEETLRSAVHKWLYRTPIHGSSPGDENDDAVVGGFIHDYVTAMEAYHQSQLARFEKVPAGPTDKMVERFKKSRDDAKRFLLAEEMEPDEQQRVRRIRVGLLFVESYRALPLLAWPRTMVDCLVEFESQFVMFRYRHARMVERTIGRRMGTGGSSGVDYLDKTTEYRVFTELWAVRTLLLPRAYLPELKNREFYGFANENGRVG